MLTDAIWCRRIQLLTATCCHPPSQSFFIFCFPFGKIELSIRSICSNYFWMLAFVLHEKRKQQTIAIKLFHKIPRSENSMKFSHKPKPPTTVYSFKTLALFICVTRPSSSVSRSHSLVVISIMTDLVYLLIDFMLIFRLFVCYKKIQLYEFGLM